LVGIEAYQCVLKAGCGLSVFCFFVYNLGGFIGAEYAGLQIMLSNFLFSVHEKPSSGSEGCTTAPSGSCRHRARPESPDHTYPNTGAWNPGCKVIALKKDEEAAD
jgi:hypothetical protein